MVELSFNVLMFLVVWGLAEGVQALRKKPFHQRIKGAAIFSGVIVFLTLVGSSTNDKEWVVYTVAAVGALVLAGGTYFIRLGLRRLTHKPAQ